MKPLRILIAAAFVLAVAALAGVAQPQQAQGQEADGPARSITAAGVGTVTTVPDRAHFSFGVQAQSRTASQALEAADAQLTRVVAAVRSAGVAQADIQTEQISLSPRTSEDGVQIVGYTAISSVSVRVRNLDRAGPGGRRGGRRRRQPGLRPVADPLGPGSGLPQRAQGGLRGRARRRRRRSPMRPASRSGR